MESVQQVGQVAALLLALTLQREHTLQELPVRTHGVLLAHRQGLEAQLVLLVKLALSAVIGSHQSAPPAQMDFFLISAEQLHVSNVLQDNPLQLTKNLAFPLQPIIRTQGVKIQTLKVVLQVGVDRSFLLPALRAAQRTLIKPLPLESIYNL